MTIEDTVSVGTLTCPCCGYQHKVTMSLEVARTHAGMVLAAVDGLMPTSLTAQGGSDA